MSDTSAAKNAWPNKQYDGSDKGYEEFETDKEAWSISNGYDEHLEGEPPKEADYTGGGAAGRWRAARARDTQKSKEIWAKAIGGLSGDARKTAMAAHANSPHDARALFSALKESYGDKSSKQISVRVKDWNSRKLKMHEDITKYKVERLVQG